MARNTYSENFIVRFKELFAKLGTDIDCYQVLIKEFGKQYPTLTPNNLTLIRQKRRQSFIDARDQFLAEIKAIRGDEDVQLLLEAKGLNSSLVRRMIKQQELVLESLERLPMTPDNSDQHKELMSYAVSLQTQINKFSGASAYDAHHQFRKRLMDKKLVDESTDIENLMDGFSGSGDFQGGGQQALPEFIEEEEEI